jgi:hypothetical protein
MELKKEELLKISKWVVRGILLIACIYVGGLLNRHDQFLKQEQEYQELKRKIEDFVAIEKEKTEEINSAAKKYIEENQLSPGDPLPPNTFYNEEKSLWRKLNKATSLRLFSQVEVKSENYKTAAASIITVGSKVPEAGCFYAVSSINFDPLVMGNVYSIYPVDKNTVKRVKTSYKFVEDKLLEMKNKK